MTGLAIIIFPVGRSYHLQSVWHPRGGLQYVSNIWRRVPGGRGAPNRARQLQVLYQANPCL